MHVLCRYSLVVALMLFVTPGEAEAKWLQLPFSSLGKPCKKSSPPQGKRSSRSFTDDWPRWGAYCAKAKAGSTWAGIYGPVDYMRRKVKKGTTIFFARRVPSKRHQARGRTIRIEIEGPRLTIRHVICGLCRRVQGWAFVGRIDRLSDADLKQVQNFLGLPTKRALRNKKAWQAALKKNPPKP